MLRPFRALWELRGRCVGATPYNTREREVTQINAAKLIMQKGYDQKFCQKSIIDDFWQNVSGGQNVHFVHFVHRSFRSSHGGYI